MTVFTGSRYVNDAIELITDNQGVTRQTIILPQPTAVTFQFVTYKWSAYDRIDNVSYRFLGNSTLWWKIANCNPEILWYDEIPPGTIIRIPVGNVTSVQ